MIYGFYMAESYSPRYDEPLALRFVLVSTSYNDRALEDLVCCNQISDAMNNFSEVCLRSSFLTHESESHVVANKPVNIICPSIGIQLLYTVHSGYSWVEGSQVGKVYPNGNPDSHVQLARDTLSRVSDRGAFVFELSKSPNKIEFKDVLVHLILPLTEMKFCGCFNLTNLYKAIYYPESAALAFVFDTQSG